MCVSVSKGLTRSTAVEIVNSSKVLKAETRMLLDGKLLVSQSHAKETVGLHALATAECFTHEGLLGINMSMYFLLFLLKGF
jgi:hypothetical protein